MKLLELFKKNNTNESYQNKDIILHFHIFKNAGSTIEWILKKNYPKKTASIDGNKPGDTLSMDYVVKYLRKNPKIETLSSHQIRFPIPKYTEFNFIPILVIRHPIDRAFSIYHFKKKETDDSIGSVKARSLSLIEFLRWNLELKGYMTMKNFQVLFLSNKNTSEDVDEGDLELAVKRMKSCQIVGTVDQMDESLVMAEDFLQKSKKKIDLAYIPQNISQVKQKSISEKLSDAEQKIGKKLMNQLQEHNKFDLILYEETRKEMEKRILKIDGFNEKLEDFRRRCKELQTY